MKIEMLESLAQAMRTHRVTFLAYADNTSALTMSRGPAVSDRKPGVPMVIRSPGIGRLVPAHPLRGQAALSVGTKVRRGTPIALLSDSGTFLAIAAPADGCVVEMLAGPGDVIGFGHPVAHFLAETVR